MQQIPFRPESYFEAHIVASENQDSLCILVLLRTCNDLFTFIAKSNVSAVKTYEAPYILNIDCADSNGVIRYSRQIPDTISLTSFDQTNSHDYTILRQFAFRLPTRAYVVTADVEQSGLTLGKYSSGTLRLSTHSSQTLLSTPIVCASSTSDTLTPFICNKGFDFCSSNIRCVSQVSNLRSSDQWMYRITRTLAKDDMYSGAPIELSGKCQARPSLRFVQPPLDKLLHRPILSIKEADSVGTIGLLTIDIESSSLCPGSYILKVFKKNSKDTLRTELECCWISLPNSLRLVSYAVNSMSYLTTDEELDEINDGSDKEVRKKIAAWWKKKDPTPHSLYNEAMVAYFRRVDDARLLYMTPAEPDGAKTERGKVFILYGPPTDVQVLTEIGSSTREVWNYKNRVHKTITFEADPRNVFKIVKIDSLH